MSELPSFEFEGYRLRPSTPADLQLASEWARMDPAHRDTLPEFWIEQTLQVNSFLLLDHANNPVFFFKIQKMRMFVSPGLDEMVGAILPGADVNPKAAKPPQEGVNLYIQFPPVSTMAGRVYIATALTAGMKWLLKRLAKAGYDAIYFDTKNPELAEFCRERLGFTTFDRREEYGEKLVHLIADSAKIVAS